MSIVVNDSAPEWAFSTLDNTILNKDQSGWHQHEDKTGIWTTDTGTSVTLVFQGTAIYLYSTVLPQGGTLNITCDWETTSVLLDGPANQVIAVWNETDLDPTMQHAVKIQWAGGGQVNIDHVGIDPAPPCAFPPATPSPVPPAFPIRLASSPSASESVPTATMTMTTTMTMTMTASPGPSSGVSLSKGAVAGIVVGSVTSSLLIVFLLIRFFRRRDTYGRDMRTGPRYSGLRKLSLPRWVGGKYYASPRRGSFTQIDEKDKAEEDMVEVQGRNVSSNSGGLLPSIRRLSTMSVDALATLSVSTPSRSLLTQLPHRPSVVASQTHRRDRSQVMTLSINTDVSSVRDIVRTGTVRASRAGPSSRGSTTPSIGDLRQASDGFSASDLTEEWYKVNFEGEVVEDHEIDDARFYAEHFSSRSDQTYTDERNVQRRGDYVDEPDDMSPDTPLLSHSPAIASSNVSLFHHGSALSHASRGNKALRAFPSRRSSLRRSLGKLSRRSSRARTPDIRTPVSKNSTSTTSSDATFSERRDGRQSMLSALNVPILVEDELEGSESPPPMPKVPEEAQTSPPHRPPSAWNVAAAASSSRKLLTKKLHRIHMPRPVGPRARASSISSISSKDSSGGSAHSRTSSKNDQGNMLSVVEEANRSGSVRASKEKHRDKDIDFLHD